MKMFHKFSNRLDANKVGNAMKIIGLLSMLSVTLLNFTDVIGIATATALSIFFFFITIIGITL